MDINSIHMKKFFYLFLFLPFLCMSQSSAEYKIFENTLLVPNPAQQNQFEAGLAAHNKKYHGKGDYRAMVYLIMSGPNAGSYIWSMGETTWSAMDKRPADNDHDADWNANVLQYLTPQSNQSYWQEKSELSRFNENAVKGLVVDYYDVKRGKMKEALALIAKIKKVYTDKLPNEAYGVFTNEFSSTKEGKDIAVVSFFGKSAWISTDNALPKKFDEVYGKGGWDQFMKDWLAVTDGSESELWLAQPKLSGM